MKLKSFISIGLIASAMTLGGCGGGGVTHLTAAIPQEDNPNKLFIVADQEIGYSPLMVGTSIDINYKYLFGIAATATIKAGYKYFSIDDPHELLEQYQDRKVTNASEAYKACSEGDGRFITTFSSTWIGQDKLPNCQNTVHMFNESNGLKKGVHRVVRYYIIMHNDDRQDNYTFNAQETLKSDFLKGLNPKYFSPIEYKE